jgi:hypothetical protein
LPITTPTGLAFAVSRRGRRAGRCPSRRWLKLSGLFFPAAAVDTRPGTK